MASKKKTPKSYFNVGDKVGIAPGSLKGRITAKKGIELAMIGGSIVFIPAYRGPWCWQEGESWRQVSLEFEARSLG